MIKSIFDYNFNNQKVIVRVDFNVPLTDNCEVSDDTRILAALPTINKIINDGGIPVIISHLGRPKGKRNDKYSLLPVANYLREKSKFNVIFANDCIGTKTLEQINEAKKGDIVLLENLRFYEEEEKNDENFAKLLSKNGDVFVNDAFGAAHRAHASTTGLPKLFDNKKFVGALMLKEINFLGNALKSPKRPFVSIIGGAKISSKIDIINNLLEKCDTIIIGGGMAFTFFKAMGLNIGKSLLEEDKIDVAKQLLEKAKSKKVNFLLPIDIVVGLEFKNDTTTKEVDFTMIPDDYMGLDIGQQTRNLFAKTINEAGTIIWNGPMGVFEMPNFALGTKFIAEAMAQATKNGTITIIGGGDSAAAVHQFNLNTAMSHISTGGGASLEFLEGKILPGIGILEQ